MEELKQQHEAQVEIPGSLRSQIRRSNGRLNAGNRIRPRAEKQRALKQAEEQAALDCQRLPFWSGTLEKLEKITVPLRETVNQFQTRSSEADKQLQERHSEKERDSIALREIEEAFETLEQEGEVPTEADLTAARELRETGWELIVRHWRDGEDCEQDVRKFVDQFKADDLETAFSQAVERADNLSDRLRREAGRVNKKQHLLAERKKIEARQPLLEEQIAESQQHWQTVETDWRNLWQPLGIKPGSPGEMLEWLQSHRT